MQNPDPHPWEAEAIPDIVACICLYFFSSALRAKPLAFGPGERSIGLLYHRGPWRGHRWNVPSLQYRSYSERFMRIILTLMDTADNIMSTQQTMNSCWIIGHTADMLL